MRFAKALTLVGLASVAGCAGVVGDSSMRLPAAPAGAMEEMLLTGFDGDGDGLLRLGPTSGHYERGAGRTEMMGFGSNDGGGAFLLQGPEVQGALTAECRYRQKDWAVGETVIVTTKPLRYRCQFARDGVPIDARLELRETGVTRDAREGVLELDGRTLELRSAHHMRGTPLPTQEPIGYVFLDRGREVGGIDLNGADKRVYLPRDPGLREAAVAASVALAVFWDPAELE